MRPVDKWPLGHELSDKRQIVEDYKPYGDANPLLNENLDCFCSYCEVFSSDLEVEHVISQNQDPALSTKWDNFLRSCGRCNGSDNKSNKQVSLGAIYLPHKNNTMLAFEYKEGGLVVLHPMLHKQFQKDKAQNLLKLVGLDKYPGSHDYPANTKHPSGFPLNDKRWEHRREAWEMAQIKLNKYNSGEISAFNVAKYADRRGFFSIWFTVFSEHEEVKKELVNAFKGTSLACFDDNFNPIPRNPHNINDPI